MPCLAKSSSAASRMRSLVARLRCERREVLSSSRARRNGRRLLRADRSLSLRPATGATPCIIVAPQRNDYLLSPAWHRRFGYCRCYEPYMKGPDPQVQMTQGAAKKSDKKSAVLFALHNYVAQATH